MRKESKIGILYSRRQFVQFILAGLSSSVIMTACGRKSAFIADKRIKESPLYDLSVVRGNSPGKITRKAIEKLGGMRKFISRGDRVVIKPNIGFNRTPKQGADTNPQVVRMLAVLALEAGASRVTLFDNTLYEPRNCYSRSGIVNALKDLDVVIEYPESRRFVKTSVNGKWIKKWWFYRTALDADKVINVPIAKQHSLAGLSMGMKNLMGVIGGKRDDLHQNIHTALVDLALYFRPTLIVLDAYRVLVRNGPQGGSFSDVELKKTVVAGVDPVAVDAFGCSFFSRKPFDIGYIRQGQQRGAGRADIEHLSIVEEKIT